MDTPLSIYVLVDALGWEVVRNRSFLDDVLPDRRWLTTILGYSSGAIPTLLTGRTPSQHGHWNLFYFDRQRSPFRWTRALAPLPSALVENRVARRVLKSAARRLSGYSGYFSLYDYPVAHLPYFDLTEKRDIYQPGGLDCPSLFDAFRGHGLRYECYNYHAHTDAQILDLAPSAPPPPTRACCSSISPGSTPSSTGTSTTRSTSSGRWTGTKPGCGASGRRPRARGATCGCSSSPTTA